MNLMAVVAVILGVLFAAHSAEAGPRTTAPSTAVESVDLRRHSGTWYEIARYANRFQRDCQSDTTAECTLRKDGKVQVVKFLPPEGQKSYDGSWYGQSGGQEQQRRVEGDLLLAFYGDYWVIGLSPDYPYAIVGEPKREYLWTLSRMPKLDEGTYNEALEQIRAASCDPDKLQTAADSLPDEPMLDCKQRQFEPIRHPDLVEDVGQMAFYGFFGNRE
jgi:apolipoprotein D and lipocalin family protein